MIPECMMSETAWPACRKASKTASEVLEVSGRGLIFNVISVITPSVPSDPTKSRVRSYPEADFMQDVPVRVILPSGRTTSSPST